MMPPTRAWTPALGLLALLGAGVGLSGCAAVAAQPTRPAAAGPRLVALLHADSADAAALQSRLQASAGVPVFRLVPLAPRRWAFNLQCDSSAACDAAVQRLAGDHTLLQALEPDPVAAVPPRPRGQNAR